MHLTGRSLTLGLAAVFVVMAPVRGQQTPATTLRPVPVTQLDPDQPDPELDGRRISFRATAPTPVPSALLRLVRETSLSIVAAPSLTQTFVGDLKNVTIREALDAILTPLDLDYEVRGRVIRVFRRELETRFYSVDYVITQRTGRRSVAGSRDGTAVVTSSESPDLYAELAEGVKTLLSPDGRMSLDRTAALLQVSDRPGRLARVEAYLETALLRAGRQVQIEARVIEVELRDEFRDGIDWRAVLSGVTGVAPGPSPASPARSTLTLPPGVTDFSALLKGLAAQGTTNVLSSPRIVAMNNEPAVVRAATQDGVSVTGGFVLSVTPQIGADGIIHLSITPSVTERTGTTTTRGGVEVPLTTVREADTMVRVRDGGTVLIAGLVHERADRRRTDMVILLTPTVVRPAGAR